MTLQERWSAFKADHLDGISAELIVGYDTKDRLEDFFRVEILPDSQASAQRQLRDQVAEALCFWQFIYEVSPYGTPWHDSQAEADAPQAENLWERRQQNLQPFLSDSDQTLMDTLIRLESLPTPIFRALITEAGINFQMKEESTLRRLTAAQRLTIRCAYLEFWSDKKVPLVVLRHYSPSINYSYSQLLAANFDYYIRRVQWSPD
jgi:hypothetical protein